MYSYIAGGNVIWYISPGGHFVILNKLLTYMTLPKETSGEGNGNPLQYSCLENPMEAGAWWATVTKSWTRMSDFTFRHVRS